MSEVESGAADLDLVKPGKVPPAGQSDPNLDEETREVELRRKQTAAAQERTFPKFALSLYTVWSAFVGIVVVVDGFHWRGFRLPDNGLTALIASAPVTVIVQQLLSRRAP